MPLQAPPQPVDHSVACVVADPGPGSVDATLPDADAVEDMAELHQPAVSEDRRSGAENELGHEFGAAAHAAGTRPQLAGPGGIDAAPAQDTEAMNGQHPPESSPTEPAAGRGHSGVGDRSPGAAVSDVASLAVVESGPTASAVAAPDVERGCGRLIAVSTSVHAPAVASDDGGGLSAVQQGVETVAAPAGDPQPADSGLASHQQPRASVVTVPQAGRPGSPPGEEGDNAADSAQYFATRAKLDAQLDARSQPQAVIATTGQGPSSEAHGGPAQPSIDSQPRTAGGTADAGEPSGGGSHPHAQHGAASPTMAADAGTAQGAPTMEAPSAHAQLDAVSASNAAAAVAAAAAGGSLASPQATRAQEQLEAAGQPAAMAATAEEDAPSAEELPRTLTGSKRAAKRQRRRQREAAARRAAAPPPAPMSLDLAAVLPAKAASPQRFQAAKRARIQ